MAEINWIEIPVLDLNKAKKFYTNVLGFQVNEATIEDEKQLIFKAANIKGMLYKADEIHNGITVFFHVSRMSEVLERVKIFGGDIVTPKTLLRNSTSDGDTISATFFDGKMGYYAKVKDTAGNILGLHSNS